MQQPAKNTLSVLGIGLVCFSLLLTWLSFHEVPIKSEILEIQQTLTMGGSGPPTYSGSIAGIDGSLLHVPIWMVVIVISLAHVSQMMDATDFFHVPNLAKWALLIAAIFFSVFAIVHPLFHPGVTPSWGPYAALSSTAIASFTLMTPTTSSHPHTEVAP